MFSSFSDPCALVDPLPELILGVGWETLPEMEVIVMPTPAITLNFVVGVANTVDALTDELIVAITGVVNVIDVEILTDKNVNGLVAVMTRLELNLPAP